MAVAASSEWDANAVRSWLERRVSAARADQIVAQRGGRDRQDDCDKATAEELVCTHFRNSDATESPKLFEAALRAYLGRDDYFGRGVYDDAKFDRHVRGFVRKLIKMTKANEGFGNRMHYQ